MLHYFVIEQNFIAYLNLKIKIIAFDLGIYVYFNTCLTYQNTNRVHKIQINTIILVEQNSTVRSVSCLVTGMKA